MNTILQITKELFQFSIALFIISLALKLFLSHTLLGKIIAVTFKNIYLTIRGFMRVINYFGKKVYKIGETTNNYLNKKNLTKQPKTEKKVVNGNSSSNVIDFKKVKQRHK